MEYSTVFRIFVAMVSSASIGLLTVGIYRLFFHPLARIPGSKLAALSGLYEFYYQCIQGGKYIFKIEEMHRQYGPIIRINPNEIHVNDSDYFDQLHNVSSKLNKDRWYYSFIGSSEAGFGTSNAELHRVRRKAMSPYFAPAAIRSLSQSVKKNVHKLCQRLVEIRHIGAPMNLSNAFRCLAADTVTNYCIPRGFDLLQSVDFAEDYNAQSRVISHIAVWHRHIPIILPVFMAMPRWLVKMVSTPGALQAFDFQTDLAHQAHDVVFSGQSSDKVVLQGIQQSDLPESEKTVDRLTQEARTLVGAGSETTGSTLDAIVFGVLSSTEYTERLKAELTTAVSRGADLDSNDILRSLPYLTAVVNEGLRLAFAVSGRLARVDPSRSHTYGEHVLPPGTVMSMGLYFQHTDPTVFRDPFRFNPDRWLTSDPEERKTQEKRFVPFGRGSRSCIGRDLALLTLYMMTANLFQNFDLELYETAGVDLEMEHDFFAPFSRASSKGLRVKVL